MKILEAKFFLFSNLDATTVILGILAILTALLSLYTGILESKDKRKHLLGMDVKAIKNVAAYCSFILTILTLIVQDKHDSDTKLEAAAKERKADSVQRRSDSIQRVNLATTIKYLDTTITQQKATLKSTDTIINRQKSQLQFQQNTLIAQRMAFDSTAKVIRRENFIAGKVENTLMVSQKSLDSLSTVMAQGKRTGEQLDQVNVPVAFMYFGKMRFYTKNEQLLWKPGFLLDGKIYNKMDDLGAYIDHNIKEVRGNEQYKMRLFFNSIAPSAVESSSYLTYTIGGSKGSVTFPKPPITDPKTFAANGVLFDISYDSRQHSFEEEFGGNSLLAIDNPGQIEDFRKLVGHAVVFIKLRYAGNKDFDLQGYNSRQLVSIERLDVSLALLRYGATGQYQIALNNGNTHRIEDPKQIRDLVKENIPDDELWRYVVMQVDLNKPN
ncbi:hypothetical protein HDF24_03165 [Mucilaginibacter sp. X4EP1]|uniref:hypothetical protein n=1 Tax=Mucilaginibacter sp. X4EP1 TaxID=2723092 RepID=UPI002166F491|nr:hypothetical protein [Mucilaginibacter sp. X4EP1]MCS3812025.1 hypothetical protein [Mucilaginibacter sp. X4EP1]